MIHKIALWISMVAAGASIASRASPLLPDFHRQNVPTISALPQSHELVIEVRSTMIWPALDPVAQGLARDNELEIGVFDLTKQSESLWRLPPDIRMNVGLSCGECTMRASWASGPRKLLLATGQRTYLIDWHGRYKVLDLRLPGISISYDAADEFAITSDGRLLAFWIYTRDRGDKSPDPSDPYWRPEIGRLYQDLIYESTAGTVPVRIATNNGEFFPAWSPDGKRIAYRDRNAAKLIIADVGQTDSGSSVTSIDAPDHGDIQEIRWSPDGAKLAFIVRHYKRETGFQDSLLYIVQPDGSALNLVEIGERDANVTAFAWSPSGDGFVFRSDSQTLPVCGLNVQFSTPTRHGHCRAVEHLFTSKVDGSDLKRITKEPESRHAQLFWIQ